MVTDSGRAKVLLFGGETYSCDSASPIPGAPNDCNGTYTPGNVWEWDGASTTWTNRTPVVLTQTPDGLIPALLSFDEGRQKMFFLPNQPWFGGGSTTNDFWEWDPITAG
jgi:hypothetical protein